MTVFSKLQKARLTLVQSSLKKSGKNAFAKYEYFELGDFIPTIHKIFDDIGLCGVFTFTDGQAFLTIHDTEPNGASIVFATPMVMAENSKGQAIQNLGSTHTYLRRYLWLMAMEIVEHDTVDAITDPQEQARLNASKPKPELPPEVPVITEPDPSTVLLVDSLIEFGATCSTLTELTSLWKANQGQIDTMKKTQKAEYNRLQSGFAKLKENFKEESA
jgi:ERF superfamily